MPKDRDSNRKSLNRSKGQRSGKVYLLWHTDRLGDEKLIGVYRSKSDASSAVERLKRKHGFSDKGGAFEICCYHLNKDHWTGGLVQREGFSLPAWFRPGDPR